jgi:hypothetical protein
MQKTAAENKTGNTSYNTRMPGGQSAAPNCRFEASVTVHLLRSGGVMSAMRQLRQCVERWDVIAGRRG